MMRLAMSPAAAALLRSLLRRASVDRDRILLTEFRSTDWQSLTLTGGQHMVRLRIPGPDAAAVSGRLLDGLEDAEMPIPGHFIADVSLCGDPETNADGSITLVLEALTVEEWDASLEMARPAAAPLRSRRPALSPAPRPARK